MCHKGTVSNWRYLLTAVLSVGALAAQTAPVEWRRVGNPAMEVGLASPATGSVETVWYSPDGARLLHTRNKLCASERSLAVAINISNSY